MDLFVLIVWLHTGFGSSMTSAEFGTLAACEAAGNAVLKAAAVRFRYGGNNFVCMPVAQP
jgi:hypothetical protein